MGEGTDTLHIEIAHQKMSVSLKEKFIFFFQTKIEKGVGNPRSEQGQ